jgi:hypothetical protein
MAMEVLLIVARAKLLADDDIGRLIATHLHTTLQQRENMRAEGILTPTYLLDGGDLFAKVKDIIV